MRDCEYQKNQLNGTISQEIHERRNCSERRKVCASGFTFISTVGWICRREQFRRKEDPDTFPSQCHGGQNYPNVA
jgi:hypothetical protein